jgi:hypothetical protein
MGALPSPTGGIAQHNGHHTSGRWFRRGNKIVVLGA